MNKCVFIGKLPEPIGGVTVFNQRRFEQLKKINKNIVLLEPTPKNVFKLISAIRFSDIIHISAQNSLLIITCAFISPRSSIVFYDHNSSRHFEGFNSIKKKIYELFFYKKCRDIVLVDQHLSIHYKIFEKYQDLKAKFSVLSAFLPPSDLELPLVISSYDRDLYQIYENSSRSKLRNVILTSAFQPNLDSRGKDVYSIDKIIDIFKELSISHRDYYFIIAIASYNESTFSDHIKKKVKRLKGSEPNLIFIENNTTIWPIFKVTKLFVRATTTDGDSVSVREALHFGAPVLASDAVPRPPEVNIFSLQNESLIDSIRNLIGKP